MGKSKRNKKQERKAAKKQDAWKAGTQKLGQQLGKIGLFVRDIMGDGNCLFRSLADQVYGNQHRHVEVREAVVRFMRENPDGFSPFVPEEDGTWEEYLANMSTDGEWGSNLELQAASQYFRVNVVVHQLDQPRWELRNFSELQRTIHVAYQDGDHYDSVRLKGDMDPEPAKRIRFTDKGAVAAEDGGQAAGGRAAGGGMAGDRGDRYADVVDLLVRSTVGHSEAHIRSTLMAVDGDVDTAMEILISEMAEKERRRAAGVDVEAEAAAQEAAVAAAAVADSAPPAGAGGGGGGGGGGGSGGSGEKKAEEVVLGPDGKPMTPLQLRRHKKELKKRRKMAEKAMKLREQGDLAGMSNKQRKAALRRQKLQRLREAAKQQAQAAGDGGDIDDGLSDLDEEELAALLQSMEI